MSSGLKRTSLCNYSSSWLALSTMTLLASAACSKSGSEGGGSFDAQNSPYGDRTATTANSFILKKADGTTVAIAPKKTGTKSIGGQDFDRYTYANPADPTATTEYWISGPSSGSIAVAGGAVGTNKTGQLDTPLTVSLAPPVGVSQPLSGSATITNPSFPTGGQTQGSAQYSLTEVDTTVDTSAGKVHGVNHYHASGTFTGNPVPAQFQNQPLTGEVYFHPSYGLVAASSPELGLSLGMAESSDCGEVDSSGHRLIRKVAVVSDTAQFKLDTYDCAGGQFDADKNTHAAMLLELRWLDDTNARSTNPPGYPMITVEFGTVIGVFPSDMTQSSTSILHPEENGQGYVYWYGYVNQAAKNESGSNGIAYHISVREDPGFSPVRASARIYYKTFP